LRSSGVRYDPAGTVTRTAFASNTAALEVNGAVEATTMMMVAAISFHMTPSFITELIGSLIMR
jgi:hypothetical protein